MGYDFYLCSILSFWIEIKTYTFFCLEVTLYATHEMKSLPMLLPLFSM
jgi:hypothetical protein